MKIKIAKIVILLSFITILLFSIGCTGVQREPIGFSGVNSYEGILYIGTTDGRIVAVNPESRVDREVFPSPDGEWEYSPIVPSTGWSCSDSSAPVSIYGTPVVTDGLACIGIYNGKVLMMNPIARNSNLPFPQQRDEEWSYPRTDELIAPIVGSPAILDDIVYISCSDSMIYALDRRFGDELWKSEPLGDKLWVTPVIKDDVLYVSTFDGHIYTLSATDGDLLPWSFKSETGFISSPAIYEDIIIVGSFDRNLHAVRIGDNTPLWSFAAENWFWGTALVDDGIVYAGCLDGKVYALDVLTGDKIWEFNAGESVVSSPIMADDSIVVASEAGDIFIVDKLTGRGKSVMGLEGTDEDIVSTTGAIIRSSLCYSEGIVYVHTQNDVLFAIDVEQANISWMYSLEQEQDK